LRILFVGDSWKGSSARATREALCAFPGVLVDEIDADHFVMAQRSLTLRAANKLLRSFQIKELEREIRTAIQTRSPDVLLAYKGYGIGSTVLRQAKALGVTTINMFPDCSPHAFGRPLREAIGEYDLVISTKPFHPKEWNRTYGYKNCCVCVPHGYDPAVHYRPDAVGHQELDVVMVAAWRPEYHALLLDFAAEASKESWRIGIAGPGWIEKRDKFPASWLFVRTITGSAYIDFIRSGRIAIAPVQRRMVVRGVNQPGDEDSTRTYELAAAGSFFVHRRTDYVSTVYDERNEVPLWDDAKELASLVRYYLPRETERAAMAAAAQARAVPQYSVVSRTTRVLDHIRSARAVRLT